MDLATALDEYRYAVLDLTPKTQGWYEQKLQKFARVVPNRVLTAE